ncbi:MAG: Arylsulfatase, partial [Verrucomicrobiota bacterium]
GLPDTQLYRIAGGDLAETRNVHREQPEVVTRLTRLLEKLVADGRSTPGAPQANAVPVVLRKPIPAAAAKKKQAQKAG